MPMMWDLWHGCHKISEGCLNCYVYRGDAQRGINSNIVTKTKSFYLPIEKRRDGRYKIPSGSDVFTCFTSDFFVEDADMWREEAWNMMRFRTDLNFFMVTKRINRALDCFPDDWGMGYDNVTICCTVENQKQIGLRLPLFINAPIKHKAIICEPLLEQVDFTDLLGDWCEQVIVGGESGNNARICDFEWVKKIRCDCIKYNIPFFFKQTGAKFIKDGKLYNIARKYQHLQAQRAKINIDNKV